MRRKGFMGIASGLRRWAVASGVLGTFAVMQLAGASPAAACSICNAEGVAVTNLLATGSEAGIGVSVTGAAAASVEIGTIGIVAGEAAYIGGLTTLGTAGALAVGIGGVAAWQWISDQTALPAVSGSHVITGYETATYPGYGVTATGVPIFGGTTSSGYAWSGPLVAESGAFRHYGALCGRSIGTLDHITAAELLALNASFGVVPSDVMPTGWWTGHWYSTTGYASPWNMASGTSIQPFNPCGNEEILDGRSTQTGARKTSGEWTDADPAYLMGLVWATGTSGVTAEEKGAMVFEYGSDPWEPTPDRTIEQTIQCQRGDGSTYSRTNSADASGELTTGTSVPIAGLSCDPGDFVTDVEATLATPGADPLEIVPSTATPDLSPGWEPLPDPTKTSLATPTNTHILTFTPTPPGATPLPPTVIVTTTPAPTTPGTDTEVGTDFCGMTFADVLTGAVIFKAFGCALAWAFVPSPGALQLEMTRAETAWNASRTGVLVQTAVNVPLALTDWSAEAGATCEGPSIPVPLPGQEDTIIQPLNACEEPMAGVAGWVKLLLTIFLVYAGVVMVVNPILEGMSLNRMPEVSMVEDNGQGRLF